MTRPILLGLFAFVLVGGCRTVGSGADISVLHALGVPCIGLWVDGHRYFDYHHTAVDDCRP